MGPHPHYLHRAVPKVVEIGHIELVRFASLRPSFSRWYNAHIRCDYHIKNSGHPMKNCTALKHKVQDLINLGKLKFGESNEPAEVEDLFGAKAEATRQEKISREIGSRKAVIRKDEVSISKVGRGEVEGSSTTERSKKDYTS